MHGKSKNPESIYSDGEIFYIFYVPGLKTKTSVKHFRLSRFSVSVIQMFSVMTGGLKSHVSLPTGSASKGFPSQLLT